MIDGNTENTNFMPKTFEPRRLFDILHGDFLSPLVSKRKADLPSGLTKPEEWARLTAYTFLFYLRQVVGQRQLGFGTDALGQALEELAAWLEHESHGEKDWLRSIDVEADLTIT